MKRRGFTIVELLIAITIMGILLVIAVVSLGNTQRNARDDERRADIDAIAAALENYYSGSNATGVTGRYPATTITASEAALTTALRDISLTSFKSPGVESVTDTFKAATNNVQTIEGIRPLPTNNTYVYQPLLANGSLCTTAGAECRRFNLYRQIEGSDNIIVKITSRRQ